MRNILGNPKTIFSRLKGQHKVTQSQLGSNTIGATLMTYLTELELQPQTKFLLGIVPSYKSFRVERSLFNILRAPTPLPHK